jgi:hypothetical protein
MTETKPKFQPNLVTVFSDATLHPPYAGYAWWYRWNGPSVRGGGGAYADDICTAELKGLLEGIRAAHTELAGRPVDGWVIQCDSTHALGLFLHLPNAKIAKSSPIQFAMTKKVRPERMTMLKEIAAMIPEPGKIWLKHVKGHTDGRDSRSTVNRETDRRAAEEREKFKKQCGGRPPRRP